MVHTFDPKQLSVILGSKIITGFADGTFLTLERNEQAFTRKTGVDGETVRVKSNDKSGKATFVLLQSAQSNDDLSNIALADEAANTGVLPLTIKDVSGRTLASALTTWVQKFPNAEFAKEGAMRSWVIETDELLLFIGGN